MVPRVVGSNPISHPDAGRGSQEPLFFELESDMARIMAIDLGRKRSGIAVTDPLQIIANGLTTVESHKLVDFVLDYLKNEEVEQIVIGEPKDMKNNPSDCSKYIEPLVNRLKKQLPDMKIVRYDERFTSVMAHQTMIDAGLKKSKRQDKELVDTIAATIILQSYMESKKCGMMNN